MLKRDFHGIYEAIDLSQIPDILLYMDQITTFMEDRLSEYKRSPSDKVITKTMINNYTKDKIIPPPEKKKYAPNQLMLLIIVFHLKHVLSITDIGRLINSASAKAADTSRLYEIFTIMQKKEQEILASDLECMYETIDELAPSLNANSGEEMEMLLLALALSIDAAAKKHLAEHIIDNFIRTDAVEKENK